MRERRRPYSRKSRIKTLNINADFNNAAVADHIPEKVGLRHVPFYTFALLRCVADHIPEKVGLRLFH